MGGPTLTEFLSLSRYDRWAQQEELTARIVEENDRNKDPEEPPQ
jgi:hypothetical protein